jgi:hypothetical protein
MRAIFGALLLGGVVASACGSGDEKRTQPGEAGAAGEAPQSSAGAAGTGEMPAAGGDGGMAVAAAGTPSGGAPAAGAGGVEAAGAPQAAGGDGSEHVAEGPPGSVGNPCTAEGACDDNLVCALSQYCQPGESALPEQIVQAVPTPDSANIPSSAPIVLFADGSYSGVMFKVEAYGASGVEDITSQVSVVTLTSASGKDVYVIAAKGGLPLGQSVVVTLSGPIEGSIIFNVDHETPPYAEEALDFENAASPAGDCVTDIDATALPLGWTGFGDVAAIPATGSMLPTSGTRMLAMSTGAVLCGAALNDTSSMVVSGPIRGLGESPTLGFDYNLQSSEFDDYCNSEYDDTLIGVLSGPLGAVAVVIDSVNLICDRALHAVGTFPGLPDGGDEVYKETGNLAFTLTGNIGSPAVLSFVLTDVGDQSLSSAISLDNIHVE